MLELLRKAVAARIASWDADQALEEALGFPEGDVPDRVDAMIRGGIEWLASGLPDSTGLDAITQEHVDELLRSVREAE